MHRHTHSKPSQRKRSGQRRRSAAATSRQLSRMRERDSQRRAERSAELAERRRMRLAELTSQRHREERDDLRAAHGSALSAAAGHAQRIKRERKRRENERELVATRQRDEWQRAHGDAPLTSDRLVWLAMSVSAELPNVSDDERAESVAWLLLRIGQRHGWNPPAGKCERGFMRRRMLGHVSDERAAAERRNDSRAWAAMAEPAESADDLAERVSANVWAAFTAPPLLGELRAASIGADYLSDALGIVDADARLALTAALSDRHRQAPELAASLGIAESAARKRLQRGRDALRERWPSAAALVAEVAAVQAEDESGQVQLSAELRAAAGIVDAVKCATYRLTDARLLRSAPVGSGRWHEGMPSCPPNRLAADLSERLPSAPTTSAATVPMSAPSAAAPLGSLADALASADAQRRAERAAMLRQLVAAELRRRAQRVIWRKWLCTLAAHRLGALLVR